LRSESFVHTRVPSLDEARESSDPEIRDAVTFATPLPRFRHRISCRDDSDSQVAEWLDIIEREKA